LYLPLCLLLPLFPLLPPGCRAPGLYLPLCLLPVLMGFEDGLAIKHLEAQTPGHLEAQIDLDTMIEYVMFPFEHSAAHKSSKNSMGSTHSRL
jgi:hypothetical protein